MKFKIIQKKVRKRSTAPVARLLSQVTGIDLTRRMSYLILRTATPEKAVVITQVIVRVTRATHAQGDALISIGTNAAKNNILPRSGLVGISKVDDAYNFSSTGHAVDPQEPIKLQVYAADSGQRLDATVELIGYSL
jgi:hypothetical protein